ncbi:MAG: hypothetical protein ACJAYU_003296 [Bradymonadia bacterium]|jgi:uncharacterized protein YaiI (UPF0178 family)
MTEPNAALEGPTDPPAFTVWVDSDGVPRVILQLAVRSAINRKFRLVLVANRWVEAIRSNWVEVIQVSSGADVADAYIVDNVAPRDLVLSDDVPLAAGAVEAGADVLQFRGRMLTEKNVREALSLRDFGTELRAEGIQTKGASAWSPKDKNAFANAFDRWVSQALNR